MLSQLVWNLSRDNYTYPTAMNFFNNFFNSIQKIIKLYINNKIKYLFKIIFSNYQ